MRLTFLILKQHQLVNISRRGFAFNQIVLQKSQASKPAAAVPVFTAKINNVQGLSQAVLTTNEPVGPGASKSGEYKVPEYFNYNKLSYFEAEVEMAKYRCPQPSAKCK